MTEGDIYVWSVLKQTIAKAKPEGLASFLRFQQLVAVSCNSYNVLITGDALQQWTLQNLAQVRALYGDPGVHDLVNHSHPSLPKFCAFASYGFFRASSLLEVEKRIDWLQILPPKGLVSNFRRLSLQTGLRQMSKITSHEYNTQPNSLVLAISNRFHAAVKILWLMQWIRTRI